MSRNIDIADDVVTLLNAATALKALQTYTARRTLLPLEDLVDLKSLIVLVVPSKDEALLFTRKNYRHLIDTDILIAQRLQPTTDPSDPAKATEVVNLISFAEAVGEFFEPGTKLATARVVGYTLQTIYDPPALKDKRAFITAVQLHTRFY